MYVHIFIYIYIYTGDAVGCTLRRARVCFMVRVVLPPDRRHRQLDN